MIANFVLVYCQFEKFKIEFRILLIYQYKEIMFGDEDGCYVYTGSSGGGR